MVVWPSACRPVVPGRTSRPRREDRGGENPSHVSTVFTAAVLPCRGYPGYPGPRPPPRGAKMKHALERLPDCRRAGVRSRGHRDETEAGRLPGACSGGRRRNRRGVHGPQLLQRGTDLHCAGLPGGRGGAVSSQGGNVDVNAGRFTLRINGKKQALLPQAPSMVAASLKHPEWQSRPNAEAGIGVGGIGVRGHRRRLGASGAEDSVSRRSARVPPSPTAARARSR